MTPYRIFIGYDHRQQVAYHVAAASFVQTARRPITIAPLKLDTLPLKRHGLTPFTFSRFLVPWLCDYQGWALFTDLDVIAKDDISAIFDAADERFAVMVTDANPSFERAAVMLFNCAHPDNAILTPDYIETAKGLHKAEWTANIGQLDGRWNYLVGYDRPHPAPGIVHYTMGVPCHPETMDCDRAADWHEVHQNMNTSLPWIELMGTSVHAGRNEQGEIVPRYKLGASHAA